MLFSSCIKRLHKKRGGGVGVGVGVIALSGHTYKHVSQF